MFRRKRASMFAVIGIVLVAMLTLGFVGNITNGFQNFDAAQMAQNAVLNEDNLYKPSMLELKDSNAGDGVIIDVDENMGTIQVKGKSSEDKTVTIAKVTLSEGTYSVSGVKNASKAGVYMTVEYTPIGDSAKTVFADFTGAENSGTFELLQETEVTLVLHLTAGAELNHKITPVIVEGEDFGSFYK